MQQTYRRVTKTEKDLKDFHLQTYLHKDSIKTVMYHQQTSIQSLSASGKLQVVFKIDALCECYVRVNTCVTEQRDVNNVPTMMFTPNKTDYIQDMKVTKGLGQGIDKVHFSMSAMQSYELFSVYHTYFPLVISINY